MKTLYQAIKHVGIQHKNEQRVKNITEFFFKELRLELGQLNNTSLYVNHLGTFAISPHKLRLLTIGLIRKIREVRETGKPEYADQLLALLKKMLIQRNELAKQMYDNKIRQHNKYLRKHNPGSIPQDQTDSLQ
jgi:hypothetical protein